MPGAKWRYCDRFGPNYDTGNRFYELSYVEDTIINSLNYQIIRLTSSFEQAVITGYHPMSLYTRYSNDTVFRFVNNKEYIYFIFSANANDKWTTFRTNRASWKDSVCTSLLPIKVESINSTVLDGQNLKIIELRDTAYGEVYCCSGAYIEYTLLERVGVTTSFPLIADQYWYSNNECANSTEIIYHRLSYYKDDAFEYRWSDCIPSSVFKNKTEDTIFSINPNPTNNNFKIKFPHTNLVKKKIMIYNVMGILVSEKDNVKNDESVDISNLSNGIYCVTLIDNNNIIETTKLIINKN